MARMRLTWCLLIRIMLVNLVFVDETKAGKTHCSLIEISNTWFHRSLEGVYRLKPPKSYSCNNRTVYQLEDEDSYLFYVIQGSWQGWMIGKYECVNKGYLSVGDRALYPDDINATWEEFNSPKWLFNKDIISGCHIPGVTRPPRMRPKPQKIQNETDTKFADSSSALKDGEAKPSSFYDRVTTVIFVAVPVGCLVIIALLLTLCILAGTHKSFLKRITKGKEDSISYDGKRLKLSRKPPEVLTDPEDASSEAATTQPTERAKH